MAKRIKIEKRFMFSDDAGDYVVTGDSWSFGDGKPRVSCTTIPKSALKFEMAVKDLHKCIRTGIFTPIDKLEGKQVKREPYQEQINSAFNLISELAITVGKQKEEIRILQKYSGFPLA